jgi:hypothetical protein
VRLISGIFISSLIFSAVAGITALVQNSVAHAVPDDKGVMMFDYGANIGKVYNPTVLGMGAPSTTMITRQQAAPNHCKNS